MISDRVSYYIVWLHTLARSVSIAESIVLSELAEAIIRPRPSHGIIPQVVEETHIIYGFCKIKRIIADQASLWLTHSPASGIELVDEGGGDI